MGWGGASRGPKERGWGEKDFPIMRGGVRQNYAARE